MTSMPAICTNAPKFSNCEVLRRDVRRAIADGVRDLPQHGRGVRGVHVRRSRGGRSTAARTRRTCPTRASSACRARCDRRRPRRGSAPLHVGGGSEHSASARTLSEMTRSTFGLGPALSARRGARRRRQRRQLGRRAKRDSAARRSLAGDADANRVHDAVDEAVVRRGGLEEAAVDHVDPEAEQRAHERERTARWGADRVTSGAARRHERGDAERDERCRCRPCATSASELPHAANQSRPCRAARSRAGPCRARCRRGRRGDRSSVRRSSRSRTAAPTRRRTTPRPTRAASRPRRGCGRAARRAEARAAPERQHPERRADRGRASSRWPCPAGRSPAGARHAGAGRARSRHRSGRETAQARAGDRRGGRALAARRATIARRAEDRDVRFSCPRARQRSPIRMMKTSLFLVSIAAMLAAAVPAYAEPPRVEVQEVADTGSMPKGAILSHDGKKFYVTNFGQLDKKNVTIYDAHTLALLDQIDVPGVIVRERALRRRQDALHLELPPQLGDVRRPRVEEGHARDQDRARTRRSSSRRPTARTSSPRTGRRSRSRRSTSRTRDGRPHARRRQAAARHGDDEERQALRRELLRRLDRRVRGQGPRPDATASRRASARATSRSRPTRRRSSSRA